MPLIDLNDVLVSLDVADQSFDVIRREEVVGANGRATITEMVIPAVGAVQPLGDNNLLREEAFTAQKGGIEVWTQTPLFGVLQDVAAVKKYQPDLILWNGDYYEVKALDNWQGFGRGMSHASCLSFNYVANAP